MRNNFANCYVAFVITMAVAAFLYAGASVFVNRITVDNAVARFSELTEVPESQIEVVRHSNNSPFIGDTHDVTFELVINGKHQSGRCTSAMFSEMVCRVYTGDGE